MAGTRITRLWSAGHGTRRAGSFSGKSASHPVGILTRLWSAGHGARRAGIFAGKGAQDVTPVPVEEVTYGPIQRPLLRLRRPSRFAKRVRRERLREPKKLRQYRRDIQLLKQRTEALAAALTFAEQQQNEEALMAAMRMAQAVQIELTSYLERRRMMQVIAITLLLLEDA